MAEVVVFTPKPAPPANDDGPHQAGEAFCGACGHTWMAVAPVGIVHIDCPKCNRRWGAFKNAIEPDESWRCSCGEHLFFITPGGLLCRHCGEYQTGYL